MIDPKALLDVIIAMLRDIPALVTEVGGDSSRIYAYYDSPPENTSLDLAIYQMPARSVMVAWGGVSPGAFAAAEAWKHQVSMYVRADDPDKDASTGAYYRIFRQIWQGQTSTGRSMRSDSVHVSFQPMDTPAFERTTDVEGMDLFVVNTAFTEIGDN